MTPDQKKLARHALGLPNKQKQSYRNRFVAADDGEVAEQWLDLVEAGQAEISDLGISAVVRGCTVFSLTRVGAEEVLLPGEQLDSWDFPA